MQQTVLIADDNEDVHDTCGPYLRFSGFRVISARTGEEALRAARDERPDLVLMDVWMPHNGVTASEALRADPETRGIPIIAFTADVLSWPPERLRERGFVAVLQKPCALHDVAAAIRRVLNAPAP